MKLFKKKPPKEKLSKRNNLCKTYADKIFSTGPTLLQIEKVCFHLWDLAYGEGYQDRTLDARKNREYKERLLLQDFNRLRDAIEDKIHKEKS